MREARQDRCVIQGRANKRGKTGRIRESGQGEYKRQGRVYARDMEW
jgi:hypothetical protein